LGCDLEISILSLFLLGVLSNGEKTLKMDQTCSVTTRGIFSILVAASCKQKKMSGIIKVGNWYAAINS